MVQDEKGKTELQKAREQKRIEKEKENAVKQARAAVAKGMKKENWMEYMEALIDQRLAEGVGGTQILTTLEIEGIKSQVINQSMENTISFVRYELCENDGIISKTKIFEDTMLVVEQAETIAAHIRSDNLASFKKQCCSLLFNHVTSTITLLVLGFVRHNKKSVMNRLEWEQATLELQMEHNITTFLISDIAQLVEHIRMYCKALGERPHKLRKSKDLFIGAAKNQLFVDREGGGYLQVFIAQLQEIRSVNEAVATAVAHRYPSPVCLCNFIARHDKEMAVATLADIQVRRGVGVLANIRRVGPEAAKRIVLFYSSTDPNEQIV
ncbi:hypothetical protein ACHWQZ_G013255 [Mnemiopsis leidyi]